jgi:hypothetical protein
MALIREQQCRQDIDTLLSNYKNEVTLERLVRSKDSAKTEIQERYSNLQQISQQISQAQL